MKKYILILLTATLLFQSCDSWLDLKPSDRITEEGNFSSPEGFKMALNGIYSELGSSHLYGKNLSYDFLEVLANRYYINEKNQDMYKLAKNFDYIHNTQKSILTNIWEKGYFAIANINIILKNCESRRAILPDDIYALVKGEALALRAMIHFDLMRVYGPTPSIKRMPFMPYYSEFTYTRPINEGMDLLTEKILRDLAAAATLLKPHDPIIEFGRKNGTSDNFKNHRYFRLNYYAVKALEARVCLYSSSDASMKARALDAAKEVIAAANLFPFTSSIQADITLPNPDLSLTSEAIFSLHLPTRGSINLATFNPSQTTENGYYVESKFAKTVCFENETEDVRFKTWFNNSLSIDALTCYYFERYKDGTNKEDLINQELPLIRIAEMYYIAAECETNLNTAIGYLNDVRKGRELQNRTDASEASIRKYITTEYMRDFWGEGQLFFYYKRMEMTTFISGFGGEANIALTKYMLPKPESETQYDN